MRILIIGDTGFIRSHLINDLKKKNYFVHGISRKISYKNMSAISLKEISELDKHLRVKKYDIVIHLASKLKEDNPVNMLRSNSKITLNILEACTKNKVRRLIFASSHLVYGKSEYLPIDEKHPVCPSSNYAITKLIDENMCKMFHQSYGLEVIILRISLIYGSSQQENLIIPTSIKNLHKNDKIILYKYTNGFQLMDLIHVDDVCTAIERACRAKIKFGIYNIASGIPITAGDIVSNITKIREISNNIITVNVNKETNHFLYDISLARKDLKFKPKKRIDKKTLYCFLKHYEYLTDGLR